MRRNLSTQHGFTLLELSIAMAVIGVVVAGGLSMSTSLVDQQAHVQTENQMDEIDKAISAYVASGNAKLPCPADPTIKAGDSNFGVAGNCTATGGVTISNNVAIGMVPVRTLGLRDRFAADEYGNRYTYAVSVNHTTTADDFKNTNGRIVIHDNNGEVVVNDASYIVVSHGGDSKGAYRYESASKNVTCTSGQDEENCNGDHIFRQARFNRGSVAGNWFDDNLHFKPKQLINIELGAGGSTASYWEASGDDIYNTNTQNVGIGTATPLTKLEVEQQVANGTEANLLTLDSNNAGNGSGSQISFRNAENGIFASLYANKDGLGNRYVGLRARTGAGVNDTPLNYTNDIFRVTSGGVVSTKGLQLMDDTRRRDEFARLLIRNVPAAGQTLRGINIDFDNTSGNPIAAGSYIIGMDMSLRNATSTGIRTYLRNVQTTGVDILSVNYNTDATFFKGASINGTRITGLDISVDGANSIGGKFVAFSNGGATTTALSAYHNNYGTLTGCTIGTNTHAMYCTGNIQASGTITPSDMRLKRDIEPLLDIEGLQAIKALRPVHYHWKDPSRTKRDIGFIAQELEKVLPDAVDDLATKPGDSVTYKGVQYEKLIAPMVLAIQQLSAENDALKARLDALEKKLGEK